MQPLLPRDGKCSSLFGSFLLYRPISEKRRDHFLSIICGRAKPACLLFWGGDTTAFFDFLFYSKQIFLMINKGKKESIIFCIARGDGGGV
jgi:hypothetical protein